jgi:hypothetical protein
VTAKVIGNNSGSNGNSNYSGDQDSSNFAGTGEKMPFELNSNV